MHDMTASDHVLTVLPLFHVGGLNIQTTPALQLGATVTLHAALRAGRDARRDRARPADADRAGAGHHPGRDRASALGGDRPLDSLRAVTTGSTQVPQRLVDAFAARGVPVLQVYGSTETCPIAVYTRVDGDWRGRARPGCPASSCEARVVDDAGSEVRARHGRRGRGARAERVLRILGQPGRPPPRRCATAGIIPATSARATPTGISSSTTARRT